MVECSPRKYVARGWIPAEVSGLILRELFRMWCSVADLLVQETFYIANINRQHFHL